MRKRAVALLMVVTILCTAVIALADGGTASDPLISKSYLDGTYTTQTGAKAEERLEANRSALYQSALTELKGKADLYAARVGVLSGESGYHGTFTDIRVKRGDTIQITSGSGFLLLAGEVSLSCSGRKVLDLSNGWEKSTGTLVAGRRYLVEEDTVATLTVTSPTAVLSLEGIYALTPSGETDYNALAHALKAMGMFKGSDTGYGAGYDLEQAPTRIQGLIMFLRLLGEEQAALSTGAVCPFTDVPDWCKAYVAYSYEKGYTKGVDSAAKLFGTNSPITAEEYMTFVLRALGYSDTGANPDFTWGATLRQALDLGLLTAREHKMLVEDPFLRAQVAYLSYYALDMKDKAGSTMLDRLVAAGALDRAAVTAVREGVAQGRLG